MLSSPLRSLIFLVLVLVLAAGAALLSACGGDDAPQTKESFILEADGVCQEFVGEFTEAGAQEPNTAQEVADANKVLADVYGRFGERLREVELPAGGAARTQARAYVDSVGRSEPLLDKLRRAADAFLAATERRDPRAVRAAGNDLRSALDAFRASRARSDRLAVAYGLNLCGNLD